MNQISHRFEKVMKVIELPAVIRDQLDLPADSEVRVTVEPAKHSDRDRMIQLMNELGAEAEANGMTPEILDEILNER